MLKSEEILNKINTKMEEIKNLTGEEKVSMFEEIKNLKSDYEIEKQLETQQIEKVENKNNLKGDVEKMENKELRLQEEKVFANYCRTAIANDMTTGGNGAIIPATIAARIIEIY